MNHDYKNLAKMLDKTKKGKDPVKDLVEKLFQSRDIIHLAHLKTTSYAAHVALGEYYDSVLGFADELVETAQGCEGKLMDLTIPAASYMEPVAHLMEMKECLVGCRESFEYEFQKNIVDEITALTAKTIYKLKFLK